MKDIKKYYSVYLGNRSYDMRSLRHYMEISDEIVIAEPNFTEWSDEQKKDFIRKFFFGVPVIICYSFKHINDKSTLTIYRGANCFLTFKKLFDDELKIAEKELSSFGSDEEVCFSEMHYQSQRHIRENRIELVEIRYDESQVSAEEIGELMNY